MQFAQGSFEFPMFLLLLDNGQKVVICYIMAYIILSFNAYIVFSFIALFVQEAGEDNQNVVSFSKPLPGQQPAAPSGSQLRR